MLLASLPAVAQKAKPKTVPGETATIENTGSTNTFGYKINVITTGSACYIASSSNGGKDHNREVYRPAAMKPQVQQLFIDLAAAMPLTSLPIRHGMRSASFGTSTYITYKGQQSPDLTYAADPRAVALKADIAALVKAAGVGNAPRRPLVTHPLVLHLNSPNTP